MDSFHFPCRRWIAPMLAAIGAVVALAKDCTIEIQRETGNIAGTEDSEEQSRQASLDQEFYQTQYGLLEARSLAEYWTARALLDRYRRIRAETGRLSGGHGLGAVVPAAVARASCSR